MPLSPSDVQFLNKLLDIHLKKTHLWPWTRWFYLFMGATLILLGTWQFQMAGDFHARAFDFTPHQPTTRQSQSSATQSMTQAQFWLLLESSDTTDKYYFFLLENAGTLFIVASVFFLAGISIIAYVVIRWNHHRRDAILINLLREKCAPELTLSSRS